MLELNSGQDTDEHRSPGALLYHSLDVGIQNWLEAHWEPPTIAKISPCKTELGGINVQQNGLILFQITVAGLLWYQLTASMVTAFRLGEERGSLIVSNRFQSFSGNERLESESSPHLTSETRTVPAKWDGLAKGVFQCVFFSADLPRH